MNSPDIAINIAILLTAYLLGSIPTAVIVCHCMQISDPRQKGSGNPGATNVLRVGNKAAAVMTLAGDLLKGLAAIWLAQYLLPTDHSTTLWMALAVLAVLGGHIWSVFLRFNGGKGVATTVGACLALDWHLGLAQAICWLALIGLLKVSALAALGMALLTPLFAWLLAPQWLLLSLLISCILFASHHQNISHLLKKA
ncbi:glycerol-3-phosphate 1-O-acyltransferase PlsY [Aliamphritea spongicola]|uniref:glycerol-3-phosphate 1-O-acyltransferase PlsY n=1 Tax=Aliamphritea spongicola TaxID=707589 RepID=UPI00196B1B54|nr:glycerol-3-phosphate 1-O-acyltransferase PlsY [Aliamphritea spongicola]MBN3563750.1 glycerol-3-phosphate 1-O-acyltransferase PlsY [Aliamphritea spongicola]